jgi:uncharacterized protein YfaS (alpha-2-macroglobulin family)
MSCEPLTVGDAVRVEIATRDIAGNLADPTALAVTVQDPDGTTAPATVIRTSTGLYYFDLDLAKAGTYAYRAVATGQNQAVGEGGVFVSPPIF